MQKYEIESWALRVVEQVVQGRSVEDSLVELKAEFILAKKAARIIAGHANAARGVPILWLIGVDEKKGVQGVDLSAFADWIAQINKEFDGVAPYVIDLHVCIDGKNVLALLFETDRAPFVVKNAEGGQIQFEVPWRTATSTKTAQRADLLRILSPLQKFPTVEILEGMVTRQLLLKKVMMQGDTLLSEEVYEGERATSWNLLLKLYFIPNSQERIFIPFHQCKIDFAIFEHNIAGQFGKLFVPSEQAGTISRFVKATGTEIAIEGAGSLIVGGIVQLSDCPRDLHRTELQLTVAFKLQGSDYSFPIVAN